MLFLRAPAFKYGICLPEAYSIIVMAPMKGRFRVHGLGASG